MLEETGREPKNKGQRQRPKEGTKGKDREGRERCHMGTRPKAKGKCAMLFLSFI